jgi:RimJ/RimL family protein N-acetyltransferase
MQEPIGDNPEKAFFLQTERLGFRPWSESDIELAAALWSDPEVTRFIGGPYSRERVQERLSKEIAAWRFDRIQYWPIFLLSTGEHVGCCGLRPKKPEEKILELGFHLRPAHWGFGYASEAARAVVGYAFRTLGARGLFAGHNPANEASRRLLKKLGFRYSHDEFFPLTGMNHPSYLLMADELAEASC